jgi:hypothetical protein
MLTRAIAGGTPIFTANGQFESFNQRGLCMWECPAGSADQGTLAPPGQSAALSGAVVNEMLVLRWVWCDKENQKFSYEKNQKYDLSVRASRQRAHR